jgi:hypothetical protein
MILRTGIRSAKLKRINAEIREIIPRQMDREPWLAVLEIAADAIYFRDGGLHANETGWRNDELREAWIAVRKEIQRLESQ